MVYKKSSKKGAVELSLNLIIMLIIGMVVLGLVISFVTNLVGAGVDSFDSQIGDNEKLKLEEVKNCPDNLCISPNPSVSVSKGKDENIFIKVRAFGEDPIKCDAGAIDPESSSCENFWYKVSPDDVGSSYSDGILISGPGFDAEVGEEDAQMYTLKALKQVPIGTYYISVKLYNENDDYETTQTITVDVK